MASETQKKNTGLIRRFIAILLTAISLTFLFWPGMISSSTEEMKEEIEERAEMYEKYSDYSRADAKALAKAEVRNYNVSLSYSAFRRQLSYLSFRQNLEEKYAKRNWKKSYYGRQYSSYTEYINDNMSQDEKESRAMIKYGAIAANVFFFSLIAVGIITIILYAFNMTRASGILYALLALISTGGFIAVIIILKEKEDVFAYPGAAMFLLPIFALAACIIYKRDKKKKALTPAAAAGGPSAQYSRNVNGYAEQPVYNAPRPDTGYYNWEQPQPVMNNAAAPESICDQTQILPKNDFWFCPACGKKSPASAMFCQDCGTRRNG